MSAGSWPRLGDWNNTDELFALQRAALPHAFERAARSPGYAGLRTPQRPDDAIEHLSRLALTTKDQLRQGYPFGFLAVHRHELVAYHESSGTATGRSTASYMTQDDWTELMDRVLRGSVKLASTDTVLVKMSYAMATATHQMHAAARAVGALVVPADSRSSAMSFRRVLRLLRDLEVTVACCVPLEPLLWAACARLWPEAATLPERGGPLRGIVSFGEPLSDAKRTRIEALWAGATVYQSFGVSECGSNLGGQCSSGRLHLWADRYLPEVYDPSTGTLATEGTGQLVITTLYRQAMPLLRYLVGDLVELRYDACDCDWHLPTLQVLGRPEALLNTGAKALSSLDLEQAVYSLPEHLGVLFWRAVSGSGGLRLDIECEPRAAREAESELRKLLRHQLGVTLETRAVAPGTLVSLESLTEQEQFAKPRYVFREDEDLSGGVLYPRPNSPVTHKPL
ncbi:phenylacetate--CoA ligase family protein [Streptomyces netropsis]